MAAARRPACLFACCSDCLPARLPAHATSLPILPARLPARPPGFLPGRLPRHGHSRREGKERGRAKEERRGAQLSCAWDRARGRLGFAVRRGRRRRGEGCERFIFCYEYVRSQCTQGRPSLSWHACWSSRREANTGQDVRQAPGKRHGIPMLPRKLDPFFGIRVPAYRASTKHCARP